ncbi:MAG: ComEC/Rec2 family competence protein [Candidatus Dojkabacteria bacterium]
MRRALGGKVALPVGFIRSLFRYPLVAGAMMTFGVLWVLIEVGEREAIVVVAVCGLVVLGFARRYHVFYLVLLAVFYVLGVSFVSPGALHIRNFTQKDAELIGEVVANPYLKNGRSLVRIKAEKIFTEGVETEVSGGLIQTKVPRWEELAFGDRVQISCRLVQPEDFDGFEYVEYLKSLDIYAICEFPRIIERSETGNIVFKAVNEIRTVVTDSVKRALPEPHASLLTGMLIGTREQFPGGFDDDLKRTGTTHIIAVSGYNVTVLLTLLLTLAGRIHRRLLLFAGYIALSLFLLVVGVDNLPALRAVLMGGAYLTGLLIGRKNAVYSSISLAVLIMLAANPYVYRSISFQLSLASTLGIIFLKEKVELMFPGFIKGFVKDELAITLAASIATLPIVLLSFGVIAIWSPIVNVIVAPLIPPIMAAGAIMVVFQIAPWEGVAAITSTLAWSLLEVLTEIISNMSKLPYALLELDSSRARLVTVITFLFIIGLLKYRQRQNAHE